MISVNKQKLFNSPHMQIQMVNSLTVTRILEYKLMVTYPNQIS